MCIVLTKCFYINGNHDRQSSIVFQHQINEPELMSVFCLKCLQKLGKVCFFCKTMKDYILYEG